MYGFIMTSSIFNLGMSHLHQRPMPGDDIATIEAELLIADHYLLADGDNFNVSFALKVRE